MEGGGKKIPARVYTSRIFCLRIPLRPAEVVSLGDGTVTRSHDAHVLPADQLEKSLQSDARREGEKSGVGRRDARADGDHQWNGGRE